MSQHSLVSEILLRLKRVVGTESRALHEPSFDGNEWKYLRECLDSTFVSSVGQFVNRFEDDLAAYTGSKFSIAVVNGTSALHVALQLAGVKKDHEVLMPTLTFVATANAVSYCGAIPHFVDADEVTLGIDTKKLRLYLEQSTDSTSSKCINKFTGRVISAIVPMHTFGHPSNLEDLLEIAKEFKLAVIEDAAESLGSFYKNKHTGTFGSSGVISFNGNKIITTGGGGAILTDDEEIAKKARHITTTAKVAHSWEFKHDQIGFNYRMPNLNAALGCAQLEKIKEKLDAKRRIHKAYSESFYGLQGISLFNEPEDCHSNYWLETLILEKEFSALKDSILEATNASGFATRPAWEPMHRLRHFYTCPKMNLSVAESLSSRIINLPSSPKLASYFS